MSKQKGIKVCNHYSGKEICYSLPLLIGQVHGLTSVTNCGWIEVMNKTTGVNIQWPMIKAQFKALVELVDGKNEIKLQLQGSHLIPLEITLKYSRLQLKRYVQPLYIKCRDDSGTFQAPDGVDNSLENAQRRIALGAQLIQTFTAEKLREHGLGEITFQLDCDHSGKPTCRTFNTKLTLEEAHSMDGGQLWDYFARELIASDMNKDNCKWYTFMSFTRFNLQPGKPIPKKHQDILHHTKGHTALGGGGLALFGTGNLHTWAESLQEVAYKFTDTTLIDRSKLMDDSGYRQFYWANYATGLGASLHELGHTFDLAHTPSGIMARGFDDIHKVFTVEGTAQFIKHSQQKNKTNSNESVVFVEHSFQAKPQAVTYVTTENYDGTVTVETVTEGTHGTRSIQRDSYSSISSSMKSLNFSENSSGSNSVLPSPVEKLSPPQFPKSGGALYADTVKDVHDVVFTDGKAHWYRASAVLLRFHKWFNVHPIENKDVPTYKDGSILATNGLRLIELRTIPEGVVFHHWEFLNDARPNSFVLEKKGISELSKSATECTIVVEDNYGNILRKNVNISEFSE